jgi:type IV pilus assembly protein PilM
MITLHIEDTQIRLMLVDGKQVEKVASLPLEPGLVENGVVIDKAMVSEHIKELLVSQDISDRKVITSISGIHSIYRIASFPHLNKGVVAEAARREFERAMPVPLNELYTSWQAVDVSAEETILCLIGLPRNTVDSMLETLRHAGLQSAGLDITPLALTRLADEKDAIIINAQLLSFDIVIMKNGIPELLRSLRFPSMDTPEKDKVALIKEELDRTVTFYNSSHKESPITTNIATYISGNMREVLSESLGYISKPIPSWLVSRVNFDIGDYAINAGLALKQVKDSGAPVLVNIDATPAIYLPKPRQRIEVISWVVLVLAIIILVPLAIVTRAEVAKTSDLMDKVNIMEIQVANRQTADALLRLLQAEDDAVKAAQISYQGSLTVLKSQRAKANGDLAEITSLLPGTVNLTSISYAEQVFIHGNAPDKATILSYTRALRDTGRFTNVIISDMHELDYHRWAFILMLE